MHHVRTGERKLKESNYRLSLDFDENLDDSLSTYWSMHSKRSELLKSAELLLISCGDYSRADYSVADLIALFRFDMDRHRSPPHDSYHVIFRHRHAVLPSLSLH